MNIHNGEIISFVSLPDFNLNERKKFLIKILLIELVKVLMNWALYLSHLLLQQP